MYAEEDKQRLTETVACRYASHSVMLLLIAETALHYRGAQVAEYAPCGALIAGFILGLGTLAHKACGDAVFGAIPAGLVVGIDGVASETSDIDACQLPLVLNALSDTDSFVEGLKGMMFDKGDALYLYVVDFGSELHAFVFLASDDRTYIRAVNADYAVPDFLMVEVVGLLPENLPYCHQPPFLILCQMNGWLELSAKAVPLSREFGRQTQKAALQLSCRVLPRLALPGIAQTGLVHIIILVTGHVLAKFPADFLHQRVQPLAGLPK